MIKRLWKRFIDWLKTYQDYRTVHRISFIETNGDRVSAIKMGRDAPWRITTRPYGWSDEVCLEAIERHQMSLDKTADELDDWDK